MIAASRVYSGKKNFKRENVLNYWNEKKEKYFYMHPKMVEFITWALDRFAVDGFKNLKKKQTREKYDELMKNVSKVLKYKVDLEVL